MPIKNNELSCSLLSESEFDEYDQFVQSHPHGWITSSSGWIKVLESSFPQLRCCTVLLRRGVNGPICGALPLCNVKSVLTGNRLVSMPFATLSDPLLNSDEDWSVLHSKILELMNITRSNHIELHVSFSKTKENIPIEKYVVKTVYKCHNINLDQSIDDIYKKLHRTCVRQNISHAEKSGVKIRSVDDLKGVQVFYQLYRTTRKRLSLPAMPLVFFESIWKTFYPSDQVMFLIAEVNKQPAVSMMFFKYGNRVSAEAMGWNTSFTSYRPVAFIYWEGIKNAHYQGYKFFDLGRTDPHNKSLMDFKARWGAMVVDLTEYVYPGYVSAPVFDNKYIKKISNSIRKAIFRNMPEFLYRATSSLIYRHLG